MADGGQSSSRNPRVVVAQQQKKGSWPVFPCLPFSLDCGMTAHAQGRWENEDHGDSLAGGLDFDTRRMIASRLFLIPCFVGGKSHPHMNQDWVALIKDAEGFMGIFGFEADDGIASKGATSDFVSVAQFIFGVCKNKYDRKLDVKDQQGATQKVTAHEELKGVRHIESIAISFWMNLDVSKEAQTIKYYCHLVRRMLSKATKRTLLRFPLLPRDLALIINKTSEGGALEVVFKIEPMGGSANAISVNDASRGINYNPSGLQSSSSLRKSNYVGGKAAAVVASYENFDTEINGDSDVASIGEILKRMCGVGSSTAFIEDFGYDDGVSFAIFKETNEEDDWKQILFNHYSNDDFVKLDSALRKHQNIDKGNKGILAIDDLKFLNSGFVKTDKSISDIFTTEGESFTYSGNALKAPGQFGVAVNDIKLFGGAFGTLLVSEPGFSCEMPNRESARVMNCKRKTGSAIPVESLIPDLLRCNISGGFTEANGEILDRLHVVSISDDLYKPQPVSNAQADLSVNINWKLFDGLLDFLHCLDSISAMKHAINSKALHPNYSDSAFIFFLNEKQKKDDNYLEKLVSSGHVPSGYLQSIFHVDPGKLQPIWLQFAQGLYQHIIIHSKLNSKEFVYNHKGIEYKIKKPEGADGYYVCDELGLLLSL